MKQVQKFYLASFLKNQTYFVPILVIFFQDLGLSYSQIFLVITAGAVFSFLIEIPTGVFADLYGKRQSIILSKIVIFVAFLAFGLANGLWTLLLANLLYELGKSFRSGTETAYVYDYLEQDKKAPSYTRVKAGQKFYARLSESIAAGVGGFVAVKYGFSVVFFLASIPAFLNMLQTFSWVKIKETTEIKGITASVKFVKEAIIEIPKITGLSVIILNIALFSTVFVALGTFVQPYMVGAGLPIKWFGPVYSGFLIIAAFLTRWSSSLEEKFGGIQMMNFLTILAVIPLVIVGLGYVSLIGIALMFVVLMVENIRSPIANAVFHNHVQSKNRATMGSILSLSKTAGQIIVLPIMGYIADFFSFYTAIFILAGIVFITVLFFRVPIQKETEN